MADDRVSLLEMKISELESQIRSISPGVATGLGGLAAFSAGSCTNTCTASCTIGCTKGCTGACATQQVEEVAIQPARPQVGTMDAAAAGAEMFRRLARGG